MGSGNPKREIERSETVSPRCSNNLFLRLILLICVICSLILHTYLLLPLLATHRLQMEHVLRFSQMHWNSVRLEPKPKVGAVFKVSRPRMEQLSKKANTGSAMEQGKVDRFLVTNSGSKVEKGTEFVSSSVSLAQFADRATATVDRNWNQASKLDSGGAVSSWDQVSKSASGGPRWNRNQVTNVEAAGAGSIGTEFPEEIQNHTLLSYAVVDSNMEQFAETARRILDGIEHEKSKNSNSTEQRQYNRIWMLFKNKLKLQSRRYNGSWPEFGRLLHTWITTRRLEPLAVGELLMSMKKPVDDFYSISNTSQSAEVGKRYKSCAVVGNSGILLNKTFGSFIDGHDAVIRLNNARLVGFETSVGTKTTISFVNSHIYNSCSLKYKCICYLKGATPIVMYVCQVQHLMDISFCSKYPNSPVIVTDPRFDLLCARLAKWYSVKRFVELTGRPIRRWAQFHDPSYFHYSSGLQAVVFALGICEKVDLLGFGKSQDAKHHYHSNQKKEGKEHDYAAEYQFYDDLVLSRTSSIPFLSEAGIENPPVQIYK